LLQGAETVVPADLEVALVPYEKGGPYPGLYLFSGPARMIRPLLQLPAASAAAAPAASGSCPELIGTLEQINLHIRQTLSVLFAI
jgi:hypothetical protein